MAHGSISKLDPFTIGKPEFELDPIFRAMEVGEI
jgi:hypothetical protein